MVYVSAVATISLHIILFGSPNAACIFDDIQHEANLLPRVSVPTYKHVNKRHVPSASTDFSPLRIYVHFDNQTPVSPDNFRALQDVVQKAVLRIRSLLSVIPVSGPLLLKRKNACHERIVTDFNKNRCSGIKPNYAGEFCENKVDKFKIPNEHLQGQDVYSANSSSPLPSSIPNGPGISDTDFVLYVSAKQSERCLMENVVAYASYCQLDINDRPVAGFVNFCPSYFQEGKFTSLHLFQTAVHEIFHTLGFSGELFSKYKDCQDNRFKQRICYKRKDPVRKDEENGEYRIYLPAVAQEVEKHFACSEDIGVPLETTGHEFRSHWDPLVMHGSIMAPSFKQSDAVWIDSITLALFGDTGWYKVNYSAADDYTWARGSGCNFLLAPECKGYPFLCNVSDANAQGCALSPDGMAECKPIGEAYPDCGAWQKNDVLCKSNETAVNSLPFAVLNSMVTTEDPVEKHNATKVYIPVIFNHPEKLGKLLKKPNNLGQVILEKLTKQVCIPQDWILNSSFTHFLHNDTYELCLLIKHDVNSTEEEFDVIMKRIKRLVPLMLDASEVVARSTVTESSLFMKGWEAIIILVGIIFVCLILAIFIASFIQIKGKIRHRIMSLPERIRQM